MMIASTSSVVSTMRSVSGLAVTGFSLAAFGSLDLPWKPGHLRSAYGAICCHRFKPKNITDDVATLPSSVFFILKSVTGRKTYGRS